MTSSVLDVYNAALSAATAKGRLSSLSENSKEREECERWYDLTIKTVQEAAYWPGSEVLARLPLMRQRDANLTWEAADPRPQYMFKYALPPNYLRAWYLTDYSRFAVHFDVGSDTNVISANSKDAILVYARLQRNVNSWTSTQTLATIYGLAGHISGGLTGKEQLVKRNFELANNILMDAQAAAANSQDQLNAESIPPQIYARTGGSAVQSSTRFIYPVGALFGGNYAG